MKILETQRLILRNWLDSDLQSMYEINQDPQVMEFFPNLQDLVTTRNFIQGAKEHLDKYGYTLYAVQKKSNNECIGFIGLSLAEFMSHFTPATEIGWRLSSKNWGQGLATEGASAVLDYAFNKLNLPEVVSFTVVNNTKSRRVMEKIGLLHDSSGDFDHPKVPASSPLKRHVLYRLTRSQYLAMRK